MSIDRFRKQFNWRFLLVRIFVNALALGVTVLVVPKIEFVETARPILNWLILAVLLGVLNALIKPVLQILTLQFLFVTYGLSVVVVNTLVLGLLSWLVPHRFAVGGLLWALVGGLVLGLLSSFLESLLGLTKPIVPDEPPGLRQQVEEQARHVDWLAAARHEPPAEEHALGIEAASAETTPAEAALVETTAVEEPAAVERAEAGPRSAEPSTPGPDQGSSLPAEDIAEPPDSVAGSLAEEAISGEADIAVGSDSEPREEQKEEQS